nr:2-hydroxy-3-oxopropionate reductase [uncultured bacterium]
MSQRIAFLGTGIMGAPMAVHLLRAGYEVSCFNRTLSKTQPIVDAGGKAFNSPREAAQGADVIITMVTDGPDVEAVLFGDNGALSEAKEGVLCIDMTTMSPALTLDIAARAQEKGARTLDAPVTGGEIGAKNATLSIMVGGDQDDFEEARPIFEVLGKTITYCGDHGAGQSVKLCNQICGAMNLLGVCEALTLGEKMGVDPEIIVQVINGGAGASWAMQNLAPKINAKDWSPGFMVETQQKDMRLIAEAADQTLTALPGAALAQQLWRAVEAQGDNRDGIQAMAKVLRALSHLE